MEIKQKDRELIENFINYLMYDECVIQYSQLHHLNIEDYIDRYEDLNGGV